MFHSLCCCLLFALFPSSHLEKYIFVNFQSNDFCLKCKLSANISNFHWLPRAHFRRVSRSNWFESQDKQQSAILEMNSNRVQIKMFCMRFNWLFFFSSLNANNTHSNCLHWYVFYLLSFFEEKKGLTWINGFLTFFDHILSNNKIKG